MPSKNSIKEYGAGNYYHLYNRGVNKRSIFRDVKDYSTFLSYLKAYLSPQSILQGVSSQQSPSIPPSKKIKNYAGKIELIAYCLMPNHFHLFVRQFTDDGIDHFMRSLCTKYVRYFNTRYQRVGHLFQDTYKAVRISNEYQFTYLTKYIHRNPLSLDTYKTNQQRLYQYKFSSYANYLGMWDQDWVKTDDVLSYFSRTNHKLSYRQFVEDTEGDDILIIAHETIDGND